MENPKQTTQKPSILVPTIINTIGAILGIILMFKFILLIFVIPLVTYFLPGINTKNPSGKVLF
jgi:hypothetical protein